MGRQANPRLNQFRKGLIKRILPLSRGGTARICIRRSDVARTSILVAMLTLLSSACFAQAVHVHALPQIFIAELNSAPEAQDSCPGNMRPVKIDLMLNELSVSSETPFRGGHGVKVRRGNSSNPQSSIRGPSFESTGFAASDAVRVDSKLKAKIFGCLSDSSFAFAGGDLEVSGKTINYSFSIDESFRSLVESRGAGLRMVYEATVLRVGQSANRHYPELSGWKNQQKRFEDMPIVGKLTISTSEFPLDFTPIRSGFRPISGFFSFDLIFFLADGSGR